MKRGKAKYIYIYIYTYIYRYMHIERERERERERQRERERCIYIHIYIYIYTDAHAQASTHTNSDLLQKGIRTRSAHTHTFSEKTSGKSIVSLSRSSNSFTNSIIELHELSSRTVKVTEKRHRDLR